MSSSLIKLSPALLRPVLIGAAIVCVVVGWLAARSFFLDTLVSNVDLTQPGANVIVEWLTSAAASDPDAHLRAAIYYERSFEAGGIDHALTEYRKAAELSPHNYFMWMNLALALSRTGDADGAEVAFHRAQELAPNYADVQWAYGNFLVRQGREQEGFPLIARAAAVDPQVAGPAVTITLQVSDGDVQRVRSILGGSPPIELALAKTLPALKRYDDAREAWLRIPEQIRHGEYRTYGEELINVFLGAGNYHSAATLVADLAEEDWSKPVVGKVSNGGFENGVKLRKAGPFEWQIGDAAEPQIALSELQAHGGRYGLALSFNTFRPEGFREISQVVPVEPGRSYRLQVWYKSTLRTVAQFKWSINSALEGRKIAITPEMSPADNWSPSEVGFTVPDGVDGIKVQLTREGCGGAACPVAGNLLFDDISLIAE